MSTSHRYRRSLATTTAAVSSAAVYSSTGLGSTTQVRSGPTLSPGPEAPIWTQQCQKYVYQHEVSSRQTERRQDHAIRRCGSGCWWRRAKECGSNRCAGSVQYLHLAVQPGQPRGRERDLHHGGVGAVGPDEANPAQRRIASNNQQWEYKMLPRASNRWA